LGSFTLKKVRWSRGVLLGGKHFLFSNGLSRGHRAHKTPAEKGDDRREEEIEKKKMADEMNGSKRREGKRKRANTLGYCMIGGSER